MACCVSRWCIPWSWDWAHSDLSGYFLACAVFCGGGVSFVRKVRVGRIVHRFVKPFAIFGMGPGLVGCVAIRKVELL